MFGMRYVLPAAVALGGVIVMAFGSEADLEGGAGILGAGLAIYAMNWLYRASVDGDRVREEEEAARTYFSVHGRWPDEERSADAAPGGAPQETPQEAPVGARRPTRSLRRPPGRRREHQ
jgi:hypothetical protein